MAAARVEFRILGPLTVRLDATPVAIGGPKQRALLALLLLSANRVVSRDRLIAELFADQSVNSADHALRNHVSRLRKALAPAAAGEPRLVARAPGYLLRVELGELDLEQFERLVAAGRESLAAGEAEAAADSLTAAERLWHGRPLADLELEPFARVEVERLEELRLAAVEERIDAELALGRHRRVVAELEALVGEHPYRERFRAQLMLALYRCGRQAEGLELYRRTRTLLSEELGLEPGVELQELERAILVQDPTLEFGPDGRGAAAAPLRDVCPYKGLAPFEAGDAEFFFGRERLVGELVARLADAPLLAIVGPSGSGKSSLLRAGLLPALGLEHVVVRPSEGVVPLPSRRPTVLAVDQFEELFADAVAEHDRRAFVDRLVDAAWDPDRAVLVVIVLRADFFGRLAPYGELADLVGPNHVLLGPMSSAELRRAIEGPAERVGLEVEPALVDALVDDVAGEPGALPLLSTALLDLWRERDGRTLTAAAYARTGGVRGAVGRHAEAAFRSLDSDEREVARTIVLRLVAGGDGEPLTRRRVAYSELDADEDGRVARVLVRLVERRLLVADGATVELVHEALLEQWPRLAHWLEESAHARGLHRHLTQAALEWERSGRESGELYRGARLAAALEWADTSEAVLNRLERAFLEESRSAFARANRRLRALLVLALVLLAAALVAGALALVARGTAQREATAAVAQRLGAQALVEPRLDRSLLLAREGNALDDSVATRSNLLAALLRGPEAVGVVRGGGARVVDDALSPDGRTLAVRGDDGSVTFVDLGALRARGPRFHTNGQVSYCGALPDPVRAEAFSPTGRILAVGDGDGFDATLDLVDVRTHRVRASITTARSAVTADVAFAPDARTLVTGEAVSCRTSPPTEVLRLRRASDGAVLRRSRPIAAGRLVGYAAAGSDLLVSSGAATAYLLDARTLARVRTFRVGGVGAISPGGAEAAFGRRDGSVDLIDVRAGRVRPMSARAPGQIDAVAFSADGKVLATASADGSVDIWDVPTASIRETFSGHEAAAHGLLFSSSGSTVYSGSDDGSVIAWDVRSGRRLGRQFRFDPRPEAGQGLHPHTQHASTAVAVSPDGSVFATSPAPGRVTLWRARDEAVVGELRGPCGFVDGLTFSTDGRLLAAACDAHDGVIWSLSTRRVAVVLGARDLGGTSAIAVSPDRRYAAVAGIDDALRVYDLHTRRQILLVGMKGSLQDVAFSPDGTTLAGGDLAGDMFIWNAPRHVLRTMHRRAAILAIRFSPDGRQIAVGDIAGNVQFRDVATGRRVGRTLGGQNGLVLSVAYSPAGDELLTTSSDGKLRLWDLGSGKLVGAPIPGSDTGGSATFFPDGKHVVAAFESGTGVVWDVDPAAWRTQACRVANRNLTRAEWRDLLPGRPYRAVCP